MILGVRFVSSLSTASLATCCVRIDPATGEVGEYSREEFEASYEVRGERALVVVKA